MRELFEWILTAMRMKYLGEMGMSGSEANECNVTVFYTFSPFAIFLLIDFTSVIFYREWLRSR
jgi:hypothetical protein